MKSEKWFRWGAAALLVVALALLVLKDDVLAKMYALSLWPDMTFYLTSGLQPGVLLPVLGSVLTQLCPRPWMATVLILGSLAALMLLCSKVSGRRLRALLPALLVFCFLCGLDYAVYAMRAQGLLFSQTLGLCFALLLVRGWQRIENKTWARLYANLVGMFAYPLIGVYGIVATLAICLEALCEGKRRWDYLVNLLVYGALMPYVWAAGIFTHIDARYTWYAGLPYMDFVGHGVRFVPLALALACTALLPALRGWEPKPRAWQPVAAVLAAGLCVWGFTFWNANFHLELAMERAAEQHDWEKVLRCARRSEHPTRVMVMYRNVALMYRGELCSAMFTYPNDSVPIDTPSQISQTEVCGVPVFFYNGLINYSARWAWEMSMMFQRTLERYKYLAKVALFTGQENPALVRKYLDIIGTCPFEGKWVRKYRGYLEDPSLLAQDEEYRMFLLLDNFEENRRPSSEVVENTLLTHYTMQPDPHGTMLQLALAAAMTRKDIDTFWYYYDKLRAEGGKIPRHVGEAAILFAYIERNQDAVDAVAQDLGGVNSLTVQRFIQFSGEASRASGEAAVAEAFKERYGDTYWYYSSFVKSLTTD